MLNTITNYADRIQAGREKESEVIDALKSKGLNIELPSQHQDMYDKIDGFILTAKTQKRLSFQLKFREGGDDIIFEIIKDWDANVEGRDLVSKAELYVVVSRQGIINIYQANDIKAKAKELLALADEKPKVNQEGHGWQLKFTVDKANFKTKLMGFFSPKLFKSFFQWQLPDYATA